MTLRELADLPMPAYTLEACTMRCKDSLAGILSRLQLLLPPILTERNQPPG